MFAGLLNEFAYHAHGHGTADMHVVMNPAVTIGSLRLAPR